MISLVALALAVAMPWDRNWAYISKDIEESAWYFDADTVKLTPYGRYRAWIFIDHSRDRTERARHSIGLVELDCAELAARWVQMTKFLPNGHPFRDRLDTSTFYVTPGTMMEATQKRICPAS